MRRFRNRWEQMGFLEWVRRLQPHEIVVGLIILGLYLLLLWGASG